MYGAQRRKETLYVAQRSAVSGWVCALTVQINTYCINNKPPLGASEKPTQESPTTFQTRSEMTSQSGAATSHCFFGHATLTCSRCCLCDLNWPHYPQTPTSLSSWTITSSPRPLVTGKSSHGPLPYSRETLKLSDASDTRRREQIEASANPGVNALRLC
ncbi:hypothetical protein BCV70DRAFT_1602 [Testicularia cyperi]|uniref:Uncharacterized protein n=1 Tax=Testicularia cyperi TaxID=1882483 RepID=A0A317XW31_9BASI|nr:hypothetical protein BCV70DRAFT_1602 [Testicularia cyperi]